MPRGHTASFVILIVNHQRGNVVDHSFDLAVLYFSNIFKQRFTSWFFQLDVTLSWTELRWCCCWAFVLLPTESIVFLIYVHNINMEETLPAFYASQSMMASSLVSTHLCFPKINKNKYISVTMNMWRSCPRNWHMIWLWNLLIWLRIRMLFSLQ